MLYTENLFGLQGRVKEIRNGAGGEQYRRWINDAIRQVINKRTYWVDLRKVGIIPIPNEYATGTASVTPGSAVVSGSGTGWPYNDQVSTTLAEPVTDAGFNRVALSSGIGVTPDSILWIDSGTPSAEAVAVKEFTNTGAALPSFIGQFQFTHSAGATVTQSSFVNRQFRFGYNYPIFTIIAVQDTQTIILDNMWGGPALNGEGYYILKMYFTLFPNIRKVLCCVDQQQGIPIDTRMTQQEINLRDAQRTDNSDPLAFASAFPNLCGNMQWEIWPAPTSARQLSLLATLQWPELVNPYDQAPSFLEPTIFSDLAAGRGLKIKLSKDDVWFDPKLGKTYEDDAMKKVDDAISGDEDRALQDYTQTINSLFPGVPGANSMFALQHDPYQLNWQF